MGDTAVTVGGNYKEDDDFVPNPADMQKTFNTSGLGASGRIEETSSVFEVDKVQTAEQIKAALDDDDETVRSDKVLLPEATTDNETAKSEILAAADARIEKGAVVNGPTPAEREAGEEGESEESVRAEGDSAAATTTRQAKSTSSTESKSSTSKKADSKS